MRQKYCGTAIQVSLILLLASSISYAADGNKGIGPFTDAKIEDKIDQKMADTGKTVFTNKCSACHKIGERYVGPDLGGITKRRTAQWTMNMIINPAEMLEKDETAQELLGEFMVPMTFQNVSKEDVRAIYEYFRTEDKKSK